MLRQPRDLVELGTSLSLIWVVICQPPPPTKQSWGGGWLSFLVGVELSVRIVHFVTCLLYMAVWQA